MFCAGWYGYGVYEIAVVVVEHEEIFVAAA